MPDCDNFWPDESLSFETCAKGTEIVHLLADQINTFYYLSGRKHNEVIQTPANEIQRLLNVLGRLFAKNIMTEVSKDDQQVDRYSQSSIAEAVPS